MAPQTKLNINDRADGWCVAEIVTQKTITTHNEKPHKVHDCVLKRTLCSSEELSYEEWLSGECHSTIHDKQTMISQIEQEGERALRFTNWVVTKSMNITDWRQLLYLAQEVSLELCGTDLMNLYTIAFKLIIPRSVPVDVIHSVNQLNLKETKHTFSTKYAFWTFLGKVGYSYSMCVGQAAKHLHIVKFSVSIYHFENYRLSWTEMCARFVHTI